MKSGIQNKFCTKEKWRTFLGHLISEYRMHCPDDQRSATEILNSLMEHFFQEGLVGKNEDGKWVLPKLMNE